MKNIIFILFFLSCISLKADYLATPLQISPAHNIDVESLRPKFVWTKVKDAKYYGLQVTTDVTFLELNATSDLDRGFLSDTAHKPERDFLKDTVYFWRVRARTLESSGLWSPIRYFRTPKNGSISEFNNLIDIKLFPNPASNKINISTKNELLKSKNIDIYLFDASGILLYKFEMSGSNYIDCSNFSAGTYTLFFISKKGKIFAMKKISVVR